MKKHVKYPSPTVHPHPGKSGITPPPETTRVGESISEVIPDHGKSLTEQAVRLLAYQKWEAAGRPSDDGVRFWLQAEHELTGG